MVYDRVLVEVARTQEVTMEAFIDGERVTRLTMVSYFPILML